MLCEKCHKRPATVHIKKIVNNSQAQINLCQQCASTDMAESGNPFNFKSNLMNDFSDMLAGFSDSGKKEVPKDEKKCSKCGSTYKDFKKTGRLGCENCYSTFQDELDTLLRRLQGSIQHAGKTPKCSKKTGRIEELKKELQDCVGKEEYERAAVIRDKIKDIKDKSVK